MPTTIPLTRLPDATLLILAALACLWFLAISGPIGAETRDERIEREIYEIEHYGGLGSVRHSDERSTGKAEQRQSGRAGDRHSTSGAGDRKSSSGADERVTRQAEAPRAGRDNTQRESRSGSPYGSIKYESR